LVFWLSHTDYTFSVHRSSVFSINILLFFINIYFVFDHLNSIFPLLLYAGPTFYCIFIWIQEIFVSRILFSFFFFETLHTFVKLLFHILCASSLFHLSVFL
jgi:hypothetical protein